MKQLSLQEARQRTHSYIHTHTYTCTYTHTRAHTHTYTHAHTHTALHSRVQQKSTTITSTPLHSLSFFSQSITHKDTNTHTHTHSHTTHNINTYTHIHPHIHTHPHSPLFPPLSSSSSPLFLCSSLFLGGAFPTAPLSPGRWRMHLLHRWCAKGSCLQRPFASGSQPDSRYNLLSQEWHSSMRYEIQVSHTHTHTRMHMYAHTYTDTHTDTHTQTHTHRHTSHTHPVSTVFLALLCRT